LLQLVDDLSLKIESNQPGYTNEKVDVLLRLRKFDYWFHKLMFIEKIRKPKLNLFQFIFMYMKEDVYTVISFF